MTPATEPILKAFSALANRRPTTPLAVWRGNRITAANLDELAHSCGTGLAGNRLERGDVVALSAASAPAFLAAFLALRRLGCAALLIESSIPKAETARLMGAMAARGILECRVAWPGGAQDFHFRPWKKGGGEPCRVDPDIAVIKLTSGSSGRPRGILATSEALIADDSALAASMGLRADERILAVVPLSHSYGLSSIAMPALMRGSTLIVPDDQGPISPMLTAARWDATFLPTVPASLQALVKLSAPPPLPESLRLVISAGAPLAPTTARRFREIFGRRVHAFYGSSECGGICYDREGTAAEDGAVGTPVDGVRVTLDEGADSGTVVVESAAVGRAYFPHPSTRLSRGRFHSYDLGHWRNGQLVLCGRSDDLLNVRGKMITPREVEEILTGFAGVEEAAVLSVLTDAGEILGAVVACGGGRVAKADLRMWCQRHLTGYKVPRRLVLVESLPRTERGKLDRAALHHLCSATTVD